MDTKKVAVYMIGAGVALNVVDAFTSKDATGGAVFGTSGFLTAVDKNLPHPQIMSTPTGGIKLNTGGWLVIVGLALWAYEKWG